MDSVSEQLLKETTTAGEVIQLVRILALKALGQEFKS